MVAHARAEEVPAHRSPREHGAFILAPVELVTSPEGKGPPLPTYKASTAPTASGQGTERSGEPKNPGGERSGDSQEPGYFGGPLRLAVGAVRHSLHRQRHRLPVGSTSQVVTQPTPEPFPVGQPRRPRQTSPYSVSIASNAIWLPTPVPRRSSHIDC